MDWIPFAEEKQSRYEEPHGELDERGIVRRGNAAYAAALGLLMAGDPAAGEWFRRAAARWRESWDAGEGRESWGRPIGALKASLLARRRRGGRRVRALDARARHRDGRVADRPLCRDARAARARPLGGGASRRRVAAQPRRLSARRRRRARVHRGARRDRLLRVGRVGGDVVRDARRVPRGRPGRRHGARARGAGAAARHRRAAAGSRRRCPPCLPSRCRPVRSSGGTRP